MPHLIAAPDKFRGTATAVEVAEAAGQAAGASGWTADLAPIADGGEGTLDVFDGVVNYTRVHGPLGEGVEAGWKLDGVRAIVQSSAAVGLLLAGGPTRNDPLAATTRGVGELVVAALAAGAREVVVGVGGTATTDGGLGCVAAIERVGCSASDVTVACDVSTKFIAAASDFAPQKGATPEQVDVLAARLAALAAHYENRYGIDVREVPGTGAGGGLAGGLFAAGARLVSGVDLIAELVGLKRRIERSELVITGEGRLDLQSFAGKAVGGVMRLALGAQRPVLIVAGDVVLEPGMLPPNVTALSLVSHFGADRAHRKTPECIERAVASYLRRTP